MTSKAAQNKSIVLYSELLTTIVMLVFFFISGLLGQPNQNGSTWVPPRNNDSEDTIVPVGDDPILKGRTIVIDPGHGGADPGTVGVGKTTESENVLAIAWDLKGMLEYAGATVIMTREGDVNPADGTSYQYNLNGQLAARTAVANRSKTDIFVSLHNDWNDNRSISGTTSYYYHASDWLLADSIQKHLVKQLGSRDIGVKRGNFYVLRNTNMPSALIEVGFLSNAQEANLLSQNWYRLESAKGIYYGIVDYYRRAGII